MRTWVGGMLAGVAVALMAVAPPAAMAGTRSGFGPPSGGAGGTPCFGAGGPIAELPAPAPASIVGRYALLRVSQRPGDVLPAGLYLGASLSRYWPSLDRWLRAWDGYPLYVLIGYPQYPRSMPGCPPAAKPSWADRPVWCLASPRRFMSCMPLGPVPRGRQIMQIGGSNGIAARAKAAVCGLVPDRVRRVVLTYPGRHVVRGRVSHNFFVAVGPPAEQEGPHLILPTPGRDTGRANSLELARYQRATTPTRIVWYGRGRHVIRRFKGGAPENP